MRSDKHNLLHLPVIFLIINERPSRRILKVFLLLLSESISHSFCCHASTCGLNTAATLSVLTRSIISDVLIGSHCFYDWQSGTVYTVIQLVILQRSVQAPAFSSLKGFRSALCIMEPTCSETPQCLTGLTDRAFSWEIVAPPCGASKHASSRDSLCSKPACKITQSSFVHFTDGFSFDEAQHTTSEYNHRKSWCCYRSESWLLLTERLTDFDYWLTFVFCIRAAVHVKIRSSYTPDEASSPLQVLCFSPPKKNKQKKLKQQQQQQKTNQTNKQTKNQNKTKNQTKQRQQQKCSSILSPPWGTAD